MELYKVPIKGGKITICRECLEGKHDGMGWDHRESGDCKQVGMIEGELRQCMCWAAEDGNILPEIQEAMTNFEVPA